MFHILQYYSSHIHHHHERRATFIRGQGAGIVFRLLASYTHLRATAGCDWPAKFVHYVRTSRNIQTKESMPCSP